MLRSVVVTASFLTLVGISFVSTFNVSAVGGNTQVETLVCDPSSPATLTIDTPQSDSVVSSMPLTISGTVAKVTQIDIEINGNYDTTVPLSAGDTSYSTQISLNAGTHTIKLTGNDACQVQDPVKTFVITYQPQSNPGTGGSTPTSTPGGGSRTPTRVTPSDVPIGGIDKLPIFRSIAPYINDLSRAVDFDETARHGGLFAAMLRFALFTLGLGLLLFALSIMRLLRKMRQRDVAVEGYINGKQVLSDPNLREHATRNSTLLRGLGVVFLGLAFLV